MKKAVFFWILMAVISLIFSYSILAQETVTKYVCACKKGCDCGTIANKPGKCVCEKEMKKQVSSVMTKYVCACKKGCDCGTIANKPGKCVCGEEMKELEYKCSREDLKKSCPLCGEWQKSKEGEAPTTDMELKRSKEKESPT